jgi:hypothetical protein
MTAIIKFAVLLSMALSALAVAAQTTEENPPKKIDVHIKIKASNAKTLPAGGSIELKGVEDSCNSLSQGQPIMGGQATFQDLPVCKVRVDIVVTGFNVNRVKVDLRTYKEPMEIRIAKDGSAVVSMGPKTTENADAGATVDPSH